AIIGSLDKLGTDEVGARVIHSGVGGITESDVTLAESSGTAIIGFNVRAHKEAREAAERAGIEIRYYNIIYDLVEDVKKAMSGQECGMAFENYQDMRQGDVIECYRVETVQRSL